MGNNGIIVIPRDGWRSWSCLTDICQFVKNSMSRDSNGYLVVRESQSQDEINKGILREGKRRKLVRILIWEKWNKFSGKEERAGYLKDYSFSQEN